MVVPSTPYDAKGLLKTSIRDNNPVCFFFHKGLIGMKEDVPEEDWRLAVHCTRTWGPTPDFDPALTEDAEMERMTMELLWMSAMITELQERELDGPRIHGGLSR